MKKTIILALLLSCIACKKKELTPPEAVAKINTIVMDKEMTRERFDKELFPVINDLYMRDSIKYKYIHIIAVKIHAQKVPHWIFKKQMENLQREMTFVDTK